MTVLCYVDFIEPIEYYNGLKMSDDRKLGIAGKRKHISLGISPDT
jgi:hypothetical protein